MILPASPPVSTPLPASVQTLWHLFERSHEWWRGYRLTETATRNEATFSLLLAGHLFDTALDAIPLRWRGVFEKWAQGIAIAHRVVVAVEALKCVSDSYRAWQTYRVDEDPPQRISLRKRHLEWLCYPATLEKWQRHCNYLLERLYQLFCHALILLKETYVLSMRMMDLREALAQDPRGAVRESALNMAEIIRLFQKIAQNKELVQWTLAYASKENAPLRLLGAVGIGLRLRRRWQELHLSCI